MSFKLVFSSFLTGQIRSMSEGEKTVFKAHMTGLRRGVLANHQILDGDDGLKILAAVGKHTPYVIEACDCGFGDEWRIFFYRTGYEPRNGLEMARQRRRNARLDTPNGMLWCALTGRLDDGEVALFVPSMRSMAPGPDQGETVFKDAISDLTG